MESELANNQEKEKKVGVAERQAAKLRLEYQDSEQIRIQFQDEVNLAMRRFTRMFYDLLVNLSYMINVVEVKHKLIFESQIQLFYVSLRMYKQNQCKFCLKR